MMNEMILSYCVLHITVNCSKICFIHKTLDMDGSALKHLKHPDYKNALEGSSRCHMHAFISLTSLKQNKEMNGISLILTEYANVV